MDPLRRDAEGFRWRTRSQIEEERSWLWVEDGVILFKAEASAWTPDAVQLQQVWVDPAVAAAGATARVASRISVAFCSSGFRRSASSSAPRTTPRSGSTRRSAWSTFSTTAPSSSDAWRRSILVRHALAGSNRDGIASCAVPGEGLTPEGRRASEGRSACSSPTRHRARGLRASSPARRRRSRLALEGRDVPTRRRPGAQRDRLRVVRRRASSTRTGRGRRRARPSSGRPAAARVVPTRPARFARGLRSPRWLARRSAILVVGPRARVRYVLDAARGSRSRASDARACRACGPAPADREPTSSARPTCSRRGVASRASASSSSARSAYTPLRHRTTVIPRTKDE